TIADVQAGRPCWLALNGPAGLTQRLRKIDMPNLQRAMRLNDLSIAQETQHLIGILLEHRIKRGIGGGYGQRQPGHEAFCIGKRPIWQMRPMRLVIGKQLE
ncbi:hypothetical protein QCL97_001235, partial [Chromobacterium amazonense]